MATAITTSTAATATAYSNQRKIDRCQNGVLWALSSQVMSSTPLANFPVSYSTDNGATWTTTAGPTTSGDGSPYTPNASFFIDQDDYAHVVYKDNNNGYIYYRRGTPNAGRTAWTWSAATAISTANAAPDFPDVIAYRTPGSSPATWEVHVVAAYSGAGALVSHLRISNAGAVSFAADGLSTYAGNWQYLTTNGTSGVPAYPSIDFNHTGDGKTVAGGTPHLYVGWSAGATGAGKGVRFRKATYSAGTWTWGTEREIDSTVYFGDIGYHGLTCVYDGTRVLIAGYLRNSGAVWGLSLWERDAADTATTTRIAHTANSVYGASASYDSAGNVYLVGGSGTEVLYRKWTRIGSALGSAVVIDGTAPTFPHVSAKRGYSNSRIEFVYTDGTASPYTVTYDAITLNVAPNAPTLVSPVGATPVDRAIVQRLDWDFSDPDAGDSQSKYDLRYRIVGAGTWTDTTGTTTSTFWDAPASTFAAGDYEWQVRTYDAAGVVGPYSGSGFFTAGNVPAGPTITAPTSGGTVSANPTTVHWSAASQDAYELRTVADNAGAANTATVYTTTGVVESPSARSRSVAFATNNRYEHIQLRVRSAGLWSAWVSIRVLVSYTPPAAPTVTIYSDASVGSLSIVVANPAPGAGQPAVTHNHLRIREVGQAVPGWLKDQSSGGAQTITPGGTFAWYGPASGVDYEVQITAFGDNSTSSSSAWTGAATVVSTTDLYGGGY